MKKIFLMLLGLVAANAFAVTPADPTNLTWYDCGNESGDSYLTFTLPTVDVNGNPLDIEMMGYRIYTDDDQIFTFNSAQYENVWGSTTDIYYYNWDSGSELQSNGVYFYRTNADGFERFFNTRIGVQVFYLNDSFGISGVSNIVYTYLDNPVADLPKPATPELEEFIDYGLPVGFDLGYTIPQTLMTQEPVDVNYSVEKEFDVDSAYYLDYTVLDPEKVSISIFTDNGQAFVFTPEVFPGQVTEPTTRFPYNSRTPNGNFGYWDIHMKGLTNLPDQAEEPYFTWRIGIQTNYTEGDQTSSSDLLYMEVYPQLKEAAEVTSTSFLADWSCDAEDTYILAGFRCYELYVVDKATQEVVLVQEVAPTNPIDDNGTFIKHAIPGAFYTVEGLTPGNTYQFYVVCSDYNNSFNSVVREVTLPGEQTHLRGDVNHDHDVTIADVSALIDYLLDSENSDACTICADTNLDTEVTIADVSALIDYLLAGAW